MSHILLILDGLTDPAFSPGCLSNLAALRPAGTVNTTPPGHDPESLPCILTLLDVPVPAVPCRGYLDAVGEGLAPEADDLCLRLSWYALDAEGRLDHPVPAPAVSDLPPSLQLHPIGDYRSILILERRAALVPRLHTRPPHRGARLPAGAFRPAGDPLLEQFFDRHHTATRAAIPWGPAAPVTLPPFPLPAAAVAAASVVKGLARLLGMEVLSPPGATGDTDTDLAAKTAAALDAARRRPFVLLHLNGADEAAHRRDAAGKRAFLAAVNRHVLPPLLACGHSLTVTGDHGTDPATGGHVGTPQPVWTNLREGFDAKQCLVFPKYRL
ncbi:MAG: hypothetical protein IJC43_02580 [Clostridia bacterium]|nr:hypothetical protein [Clostridia bacterium]